MARVVLITGAASGLGCALAHEFLDAGWNVIATDIDDLSMAWMIEYKQAIVINMDVTSDDSVLNAFNLISRRNIVIDLVINNAGIDRYFPLSEAPVGQFRQVFEVNVFGAYRVNQVFLHAMRTPGGRIIHISSESLHLTVPFMPYPLTKNMLEGYSRVLRIELRFMGIDVVVIRPGAIRTRLLETISRSEEESENWELSGPFRKFTRMAPGFIGKTLPPEKVASFILKVAGIRRPRAVYRINNMLKLRIAALLPFGWYEKMVYKMLAGEARREPKPQGGQE